MKIKSGFNHLDKVLGGGFPEHATVLISGGPGTGKTLFSLKYLMEGLKKKERCCYVSLSENQAELLRASEQISSLKNLKNHLGKNFAMEHIPLGENLSMRRFNDIISSYPKLDRLVIDNINKLLTFAMSKRTYRIHMSELLARLRQISKSTLLICEAEEGLIDTGNGEAFECDGALYLSVVHKNKKPTRAVQINKLRYTAFEPKIPYEYVITHKDIDLSGQIISL